MDAGAVFELQLPIDVRRWQTAHSRVLYLVVEMHKEVFVRLSTHQHIDLIIHRVKSVVNREYEWIWIGTQIFGIEICAKETNETYKFSSKAQWLLLAVEGGWDWDVIARCGCSGNHYCVLGDDFVVCDLNITLFLGILPLFDLQSFENVEARMLLCCTYIHYFKFNLILQIDLSI